MIYTRPCYLEVNLDKLKHNYFEIKKHLKQGTEIIAIVKSDAYHFGDVEITKKLITLGVEKFAVATMSEAISLRKNFKDIDILLLGPMPEYLIEKGINVSRTLGHGNGMVVPVKGARIHAKSEVVNRIVLIFRNRSINFIRRYFNVHV